MGGNGCHSRGKEENERKAEKKRRPRQQKVGGVVSFKVQGQTPDALMKSFMQTLDHREKVRSCIKSSS